MSERPPLFHRRFMGRGMWVVGWLAVLLWLGAGVAGYLEKGGGRLPTVHVGIALLATLILDFAHCWVVLYCLGISRLSEDTVSREGFDTALARLPARWLAPALPWILGAGALAPAVFAAGVSGFTRYIPIAVHVAGGALVLLVQVVALLRERRLMQRIEWLIQVLGEAQ